eukprot:scaffold3199_cov402-Prasinococcus_capsulatus_cf.AAC.11
MGADARATSSSPPSARLRGGASLHAGLAARPCVVAAQPACSSGRPMPIARTAHALRIPPAALQQGLAVAVRSPHRAARRTVEPSTRRAC